MSDKKKYKAFFLGFCGCDWSTCPSESWVSAATEFGIGHYNGESLCLIYCTIPSKCSWGVMCDAHEHYLTKFMAKRFVVTGAKTVHLGPK
jgi:hypothetical protein